MGGKASETFYAALWQEFIADRRSSWIFGFLRKKRVVSGNDFSGTSLDELLSLLANRGRGLNLSDSERDWVLSLGGDALRGTRARGDRAKYGQLRQVLRERPGTVDGAALEKLRGLVLDAAAEKDTMDFFYNAGFRRPEKYVEKDAGDFSCNVGRQKPNKVEDRPEHDLEEPAEEQEEAADKAFYQARQAPRRKDRAFEMLDQWCVDTSHTLRAACGLTPETRGGWNKMFLLLQNMEEPTRIVLPVQIDPATGVGLYLVGIEQYWNEDLREQLAGLTGHEGRPCNCIFLCFAPSDFVDQTEERKVSDVRMKLKYGTQLSCAPRGDTICCVTLEEGERQFEFLLKNEWMAYEFFRENNGPAPAGTPEVLKIYFEREEPDEGLQQLVAEGKADFARDQKKNPMPRKR